MAAAAPGVEITKKLIEFGWDEPDPAFLRKHITEMEQMPFDGVVFHANYTKPDGRTGSFLDEAWGRRAFTMAELQPALRDLQATRFRRFTDNFIRFNVTPGNVDWFDDFSAVRQNARLVARFAREGKCRGILFDIEQYGAPLFEYRKCRDAATRSWEAYAAQARQRGREVMDAFQEGFPDVVVFLTYAYSLPWLDSHQGRKPLADVKYGLLVPFLDGMFEVCKRPKAIVEGAESAYSFRDPALFGQHYQALRQSLQPLVADQKKYEAGVSIGFGIWMDYQWRKRGWDTNDLQKNFYAPEAFEASVRQALKVSDEFVWIYAEQPRWWSAKGKPINLPQAYIEALRRARMEAAK